MKEKTMKMMMMKSKLTKNKMSSCRAVSSTPLKKFTCRPVSSTPVKKGKTGEGLITVNTDRGQRKPVICGGDDVFESPPEPIGRALCRVYSFETDSWGLLLNFPLKDPIHYAGMWHDCAASKEV